MVTQITQREKKKAPKMIENHQPYVVFETTDCYKVCCVGIIYPDNSRVQPHKA